jgi:hypothetical protein
MNEKNTIELYAAVMNVNISLNHQEFNADEDISDKGGLNKSATPYAEIQA